MANSQNSRDLIKGALSLVGEVGDGSSEYHALAESFLNDVYLAVLSGGNEFDPDVGEPWIWARNTTPRNILLRPVYETGSVSLTNGSSSGTFTSTPASSLGSFKYRWLKMNDRSSYYLITAHTAGSANFTIDREYIEATGTLSFKAIPLLYNLGSGILRLVEPMRIYGNSRGFYSNPEENGKIYGISLNEFRRQFPIQLINAGVPNRFASQRRNDDEWWVELNCYVDELTKVDFDCIEIPAGLYDSEDSIPLLPREFRSILKYGTAHFLAMKKEEEEKAKYFFDVTRAKLQAMKKNDQKETTVSGKDKGKLQPRQEELRGNRLLGYT